MAVHLLFHIVASFLMIEMATVVILLVPFIRARTWQKVVDSQVWPTIRKTINATLRCEFRYKYFIIGVITIVTISFLDAGRDVYRHYFPDDTAQDVQMMKENPCAYYIEHEKYYRESKNFLVTGFTLYLTIVLVLLRKTLTEKAMLEQVSEKSKTPSESSSKESSSKEIADLRDSKTAVTIELKKTKEALTSTEAELTAMTEKYRKMGEDFDALTEAYNKQMQQNDVGEETKKEQ
ncbi:B-cell receptor-associated protein 31-like isoform X2 [Glandiceps talaboti]